MVPQSLLDPESLLDAHGSPSRRWAELGVVRASDLAAHRSGARGSARRRSAPDAAAGSPRVAESIVPTEPTVPAEPDGPGPPPPSPEGAPMLRVAPALAGLLPGGGLRRGSTVAMVGSTALVLAMVAEASRAGSWCAVVGLPALGMQAAAEAGLDLARTALVPRPGPRPAVVAAALVDGVDVVVLGDAAGWSAGDRQRLRARVRQRGAVLLPTGPPGVWPGADAELRVVDGAWSGLGDDGAGRLRSRRVQVRCVARGRPGEPRASMLLPGPGGRCEQAAERPGEDPAGVIGSVGAARAAVAG